MREFILSAIVFSVVATAGVGAASENFSGIDGAGRVVR